MAAPLYFFPGVLRAQLAPGNRLSRAILAARGLDRTLADVLGDDVQLCCSLFELVGAGPGGRSGTMLTVLPVSGEAPLRLGYFPDFQDWHCFGGSEVGGQRSEIGGQRSEVWVGVDEEHPPTPEDLRRKRLYEGYEVELAGQPWKIPVIRNPLGTSGLPMTWHREPSGATVERIKPEFAALWERFAKVLWLFNDVDGPYPIRCDRGEALDLCLDAIAVNYRIGPIEQNLLSLVDSENWLTVLAAAVDWPTYRDVYEQIEEQKKTRLRTVSDSAPPPPGPASSSISPGPPGASPGTTPVTAS